MEHTATPWEFIEHSGPVGNIPSRMQGYSFGVQGRGTDGGMIFTYTPSNIDFIERACNSHDELVEAIKDALDIILAYQHIPAQFKACQILQQAIARTEWKEV